MNKELGSREREKEEIDGGRQGQRGAKQKGSH